MQQLYKLIEAYKQLRAENDSIKAENTAVKKRISELDEHVVERITKQKDSTISKLQKELADCRSVLSCKERECEELKKQYHKQVDRWNGILKEPEFSEAYAIFQKRKQREERRNATIELFIRQGHDAQREFAMQRGRSRMTDSELFRIYYGILAIAVRDGLTTSGKSGTKCSAKRFLDGCDWSGTSQYVQGLHSGWTEQFVERLGFPDDAVENFISFVDEMSGSEENYVSLSGSNGCADQLTNWDGTKKRGLGAAEKKNKRMSI